MREIKFRCWDGKKMLPVRLIDFDMSGKPHEVRTWEARQVSDDAFDFDFPVHIAVEVKLMQFTGLTDKNGNEIFEGDIVSHNKRLYEVAINFNGFYLQRYKLWRGRFKPSFCYSLSLFTKPNGSVESAEVVGNVYENKSLISDPS